MIRTIVCQKEGCKGNSFYINNHDGDMTLVCKECSSEYKHNINNNSLLILSNCSSCNNDAFKVFKDTETEDIYLKCTVCGNPPENIYVDADGNQISYDTKVLNDVKEIIYRVEQRINTLERDIENLGSGQVFIEQSIAYINQFLSETK
ncbi:hypothetical protein [Clostridium sp.]|uniref:hypothetical protein n=1 Tax=Clostridium sp. TaxID=1506 RepID=UPI0026121C2B|nr:hypothetical protein [Clostridium sp.]